MSNGVGEGGRIQSREKRKLCQGNDFAYAITRMAVAQICESVEVNMYQDSQAREGVRFSSFQESALDKLTSVAVQYIQSIGKTAQFYANVAGRVEGNSLDIVQALEDLGSGVGFDGVSETERCLADSSVVKDVIRYTGEAEEMPFVYALPRFPVNKEKRTAPSFYEVGVETEHVPIWLPAFPRTKSCNLSEEADAGAIEGEVADKKNGSSLPSIQHSLNGGGSSEVLNDVRKSTEGEEAVEGNPFLTAPLRFMEKEVSPVFLPLEFSTNHVLDKPMSDNHHIPVVEASTPSNDINMKNGLAESEDGEKKDGARPQQTLLRFKIGTLKRPSCLAIKRSVQEQGWFQEGGDKREKKLEIEENRQRIDLGTVDSDVK